MGRTLSTAVSDAILALSVFYVVSYLITSNIYAALGLMIQGFAASVGVARFSSDRPSTSIMNAHNYLSWLAAVVGMPLVAVAFCKYTMPYLMNLNFMFALAVVLTAKLMTRKMEILATQATSGFAMFTIFITSFYNWNVSGVAAAVVYVVAGLVIGNEGKMGNFPRVDILHYVLAVGNLLFLRALYQ